MLEAFVQIFLYLWFRMPLPFENINYCLVYAILEFKGVLCSLENFSKIFRIVYMQDNMVL